MTTQGASISAEPAASRKWRKIASALFLIIASGAATALLIREREAISDAVARVDPTPLGFALVASIINIALTWISWRVLLGSVPVRISWPQSARVFFVGQMGKYLPGSVWSYLATAELARQGGLPRTSAMASLMLAVLIGAGSGIAMAFLIVPDAIGLLALEWWMPLLVVPLALVLKWPPAKSALLRTARIDFPIQARSLVFSGAVAGIAWLFAGAQIALLVLALDGQADWTFVIEASGIYALAWVAGFLFFIAPAGLGAREGVLVGLLAAHMPFGDALVIALLSRATMTVADFALGSAAFLIRAESVVPATAPRPHQA